MAVLAYVRTIPSILLAHRRLVFLFASLTCWVFRLGLPSLALNVVAFYIWPSTDQSNGGSSSVKMMGSAESSSDNMIYGSDPYHQNQDPAFLRNYDQEEIIEPGNPSSSILPALHPEIQIPAVEHTIEDSFLVDHGDRSAIDAEMKPFAPSKAQFELVTLKGRPGNPGGMAWKEATNQFFPISGDQVVRGLEPFMVPKYNLLMTMNSLGPRRQKHLQDILDSKNAEEDDPLYQWIVEFVYPGDDIVNENGYRRPPKSFWGVLKRRQALDAPRPQQRNHSYPPLLRPIHHIPGLTTPVIQTSPVLHQEPVLAKESILRPKTEPPGSPPRRRPSYRHLQSNPIHLDPSDFRVDSDFNRHFSDEVHGHHHHHHRRNKHHNSHEHLRFEDDLRRHERKPSVAGSTSFPRIATTPSPLVLQRYARSSPETVTVTCYVSGGR